MRGINTVQHWSGPLATLALCIGLSACGGKGMMLPVNDDSGGGGGAEDMAQPAEADMTMGMGGGLNLSGVWGSRIVNAQVFDGPLGMDDVTIITLARLELTHNGTMTSAKSRVCSVKLTPYKGNETLYPDAALAAIPEETNTATLSENKVGADYKPQRRVQLLGWKATGDPATEALPQKPDDARVVDADKDQKPGVTLEIKGLLKGFVYVVNRSIIDFTSTIASKDRINGTSKTEQLQVVLDASNPLLKGVVKTAPNPDPSKSTFTMVRLPTGGDSCEALVKNADTLFK